MKAPSCEMIKFLSSRTPRAPISCRSPRPNIDQLREDLQAAFNLDWYAQTPSTVSSRRTLKWRGGRPTDRFEASIVRSLRLLSTTLISTSCDRNGQGKRSGLAQESLQVGQGPPKMSSDGNQTEESKQILRGVASK